MQQSNAHPAEPIPSGGLIQLRQVVKKFKNAAGEVTVLKGIDADFYEHQFVSIVGRSGSGKSTLLNMMTGIDHPSAGTVQIAGTFLHTMNEGQMSVWRGRQMGIVFQFFQLLPMLTLLENVMLPMDFCNMYAAAEREPLAMDLLKMVGLEGFEHKYPAAVSGGQQQTAAVARALANDPPILVADEPTGNLDSRTAERVLEIFEEQVTRGKTVLMVTHDNSLAMRARRKLVIADGELVAEPLSQVFPFLAHNALLQLHHAAQPRTWEAGADLGASGALPGLVVVIRGRLDLRISGANSNEIESLPLGEGQFFSAGDARALGERFQNLRVAEPTQALVVEELPEAPDLIETLERMAERYLIIRPGV